MANPLPILLAAGAAVLLLGGKKKGKPSAKAPSGNGGPSPEGPGGQPPAYLQYRKVDLSKWGPQNDAGTLNLSVGEKVFTHLGSKGGSKYHSAQSVESTYGSTKIYPDSEGSPIIIVSAQMPGMSSLKITRDDGRTFHMLANVK